MACLVFVFTLIVGCSSHNAHTTPPTAKVSGKVTLDGKPMAEGEIRFNVAGQPPQICPIKDGAYSGEAYIGKNRVEIVLEKDGPPSTTDPKTPTKINIVAPKELVAEINASGATPSSFEVTSAGK